MGRSLTLAAIFALVVTAWPAAEVQAATPTVTLAAADTMPLRPGTSRGLFERRLTFKPAYLVHLFAGDRRPALPSIEIEVSPPSQRGRAAAYARMYGIDEALALTIIKIALAEGLDPDLGFRLVRVESVFEPRARGSAGALGLTQLMPSTARALDSSIRTEAQILDPETNLRLGFRYLRRMIDMFDGDVRLAVLAYNRGETAVIRAIRRGRDPENGYSPKVLGRGENRYAGEGLSR